MGQQQSKDELLYQQVNYGNAEGIKSLHRDGASLEWLDREGKTPLTLACLNPEHYGVAKTLIELGANVNAYRPGRNGGTPLHHAAKRGLENIVKLLLSHGANPLAMNDDCQNPLEVARAKGHGKVVREIENHICLFSGWLREFYGLGFLEVLAPQLFSRKVWVVVLPTGSRKPSPPFKLELAIYSSVQDAQPLTVVSLWKANLEDPKFHQFDPSVTIVDNSTIPRGRRRRRARCRRQTNRQRHIKLAPANEGDKQQLKWFCDACKGIPQAMHPPAFLLNSKGPTIQATAPPSAEDTEMQMAINASIQSAMAEKTNFNGHSGPEASTSTSWNNSSNGSSLDGPKLVTANKPTGGEWVIQEAGASSNSFQQAEAQNGKIHFTQTGNQAPYSIPSVPHVIDEIVEDGPIHYPSIDLGLLDMSNHPPVEKKSDCLDEKEEIASSSSCVICLDAPVQGACIPCGHMAGCMSCLKDIKAKKWGCPVCRAKIEQVIRLYSV
ncbi:hypothetical protein K2173_021589 [Erythroxylum novogranatense]|uniref:RING-type domain-containing protein n=1 Tax=Erythroxylum novogranatense TaxID=1862640 RepID=A0AAV8TPQ0_9ROSI|nr:hypothetical protein K2173_021589 [Erythroxylum novogranatense]